MTDEQLETVVARTGHERYRWLVSDDNPDAGQREAYRAIVRSQATGEPAPPYPGYATQAANLAGAAARFVASGLAVVSREEYDRRRAICRACPKYDAAQDRCTVCACYLAVKPWARSEACPKGHWGAGA